VGRVACLRAGVVASIIVAAGAQAAVALPVDRATLPTVVTPAAANNFSLFAGKSQTSDAHGALSLHVFGFERIAANGFDTPAPSYFGSVPLGLGLDRILDLPSASLGANAAQNHTIVTDAVFGIATTPSSSGDLEPAPIAFAALSSTTVSNAPGANPVTLSSSASVGLKFKLLGGEHVVSADALSTQNSVAPIDYLNSSPYFFGGPVSAPATAVIGLDRTFQRLSLGAPNSGSLLAIGSGSAFTTPAFAPAFRTTAPLGTDASVAQGASVQLNFPLTLGNVDARLSLSGRELRDMRPTLIAPSAASVTGPSTISGRYQEFRGGVTIGVPVFKRKAEVSLNGVVDRLVSIEKTPTAYGVQQPLGLNPFVPASTNLLTQSNQTLTLDPNYVNLRRYVGAYAVAVPISTALTANMQYVDQRYGADAVNAFAPDLSVGTREATFGVLYKIPNTNASINLNFNQYKFLDDLTPANNFTKNRQNLFFTVKF
jgi:hypothetical protein